jgi:hypothetical protein
MQYHFSRRTRSGSLGALILMALLLAGTRIVLMVSIDNEVFGSLPYVVDSCIPICIESAKRGGSISGKAVQESPNLLTLYSS